MIDLAQAGDVCRLPGISACPALAGGAAG